MKFKLSQLVKVGAFVIPIVPAASMADQVFKEVSVGTSFAQFVWVTSLLAFVGGIGFELVGIGAGHLSVRYFVEKRWSFFALALTALLVYVGVGFYKFGATTSGLFLIIAPFVYLLSGMIEISEAEEVENAKLATHEAQLKEIERLQEIEDKKAEAEFKRAEKAKEAEHKRHLQAVNQVSGKVASGFASGLQQLAKLVANESLVNKVLPEVKGTKKVIIETLIETPSATRAQLATKAGVSPQAISNNTNSLAKMFFEVANN